MCKVTEISKEDIELYKSLQFNDQKGYWFYIVSTNVRRSGMMRVSNKKHKLLKDKYDKLTTK